MSNKVPNSIRFREIPKDVFITPPALALCHIERIGKYVSEEDRWYDPFKNSGNYYNQFKTENKDWAEILEDRDFFTYEPEKIDVICSNPPYSMITKVLQRTIELQPKVVSYLLLAHHITSMRLEMMEKAGYSLQDMHIFKVYKWYGMSLMMTWVKTDKPPVLTYNRKIWRED